MSADFREALDAAERFGSEAGSRVVHALLNGGCELSQGEIIRETVTELLLALQIGSEREQKCVGGFMVQLLPIIELGIRSIKAQSQQGPANLAPVEQNRKLTFMCGTGESAGDLILTLTEAIRSGLLQIAPDAHPNAREFLEKLAREAADDQG